MREYRLHRCALPSKARIRARPGFRCSKTKLHLRKAACVRGSWLALPFHFPLAAMAAAVAMCDRNGFLVREAFAFFESGDVSEGVSFEVGEFRIRHLRSFRLDIQRLRRLRFAVKRFRARFRRNRRFHTSISEAWDIPQRSDMSALQACPYAADDCRK